MPFDKEPRSSLIDRLQTGSIWLLGLAAAACSPPSQEPAATPEARSFHLTLHGYNYTDTEIGSFEVDGQGGGNVAVSTPTGGGGKSTCCITLHTPLVQPRPVTIKWSRDSDTWCEQEVLVRPPVPARPEYLEVHFYRDGHVEVAITEDGSPPRLKLDRVHGNSRHPDPATNVNNDNAFSKCRLGY